MGANDGSLVTARVSTTPPPPQPVIHKPSAASEFEVARLKDAIRTLATERDQLAARVETLEQSVGDITASISSVKKPEPAPAPLAPAAAAPAAEAPAAKQEAALPAAAAPEKAAIRQPEPPAPAVSEKPAAPALEKQASAAPEKPVAEMPAAEKEKPAPEKKAEKKEEKQEEPKQAELKRQEAKQEAPKQKAASAAPEKPQPAEHVSASSTETAPPAQPRSPSPSPQQPRSLSYLPTANPAQNPFLTAMNNWIYGENKTAEKPAAAHSSPVGRVERPGRVASSKTSASRTSSHQRRNAKVETGIVPTPPQRPQARKDPTQVAQILPGPPPAQGQNNQVRNRPEVTGATKTEFGVDLGGEASLDALRARWTKLRGNHNAALNGLQPLVGVREGSRPGTVELHLIAGPFTNAGTAARVCAQLQTHGIACKASEFDGQRLSVR